MNKFRRKQNHKESASRHHRKPRSLGGSSKPENISWLTRAEHEAFHTLFGNAEVPTIANILNRKFIDPEWTLVAQRRRK